MEKLGCVVLAAGNALRFGGNKLAADLGGRPLIRRALEAVPPACFQSVAVVTQYPEILELAEAFRFSAVRNDRPELGLSRSLQLGLAELQGCAGALFLVSDQPLLRRESVAALAELWQKTPADLAALSHGGVRGNPCVFPAACFPALMALTGDQGGASVARAWAGRLHLLEVPAEELWDVDTPEALGRLAARRGEAGL